MFKLKICIENTNEYKSKLKTLSFWHLPFFSLCWPIDTTHYHWIDGKTLRLTEIQRARSWMCWPWSKEHRVKFPWDDSKYWTLHGRNTKISITRPARLVQYNRNMFYPLEAAPLLTYCCHKRVHNTFFSSWKCHDQLGSPSRHLALCRFNDPTGLTVFVVELFLWHKFVYAQLFSIAKSSEYLDFGVQIDQGVRDFLTISR